MKMYEYERKKQNDGAVDRFKRAVIRRRREHDASDTLDEAETSDELMRPFTFGMSKQPVDKCIH